ncbi:biopolymer transporter ExbD [Photobacterium damselae]|uniref:biopolymer transporter ExbD n=1 Tax=Photobacterium damselae TaxID=38293 RepID=UPI004069092D
MGINNYLKTSKKRINVSVNLTSLMDIFTVIVFFLLFNVHDESFIKTSNDIRLPISEFTKSSFRERKDGLSLEIKSPHEFILNGESLKEISNVEKKINEMCKDEKKCSYFLIYAKDNEKYSLVNSFVQMVNKYNFKNTYFIVKQV